MAAPLVWCKVMSEKEFIERLAMMARAAEYQAKLDAAWLEKFKANQGSAK